MSYYDIRTMVDASSTIEDLGFRRGLYISGSREGHGMSLGFNAASAVATLA